MNTTRRILRARKPAAALALSVAAGVAAGCGASEPPEPGAETESRVGSSARTGESSGATATEQVPEDGTDNAYTGPYNEESGTTCRPTPGNR